jgi:hypothetical protein
MSGTVIFLRTPTLKLTIGQRTFPKPGPAKMYISVDAVAGVRSGESGEVNLVVVPQKSSTENPAGIRVHYPSDWTIQESKPSGTRINIATFVSPTGPNSNPTADIAIYIDSLHNSTTNLNNFAQYSLDGYKNFFSAFKLLKLNTHLTLDGHSAYALVGIYQDSSFGLQKLMEVGTVIGDKAYYVQYIADAPRYSNYLPVVQNMINSLQITSYPVPTIPANKSLASGIDSRKFIPPG